MFKKYKNNIYKYLLITTLLLVVISITVPFFKENKVSVKTSIINSVIDYKNNNTIINVNYPRFKKEKIDKVISNYIYDYVKNFRLLKKKNKSLTIDYKIYNIDNYINVVFIINNTQDNIKYKNIIFNLNNNEVAYISNLFDKLFIENNVNELVYYKYSKEIYDNIKNSNINNHTYLINDNKIDIYFDDLKFKNIDYIPNITIYLNKNVSNNEKIYKYPKFIAFTFDDGPSKYTSELLKTLKINNSSATFFMIGNRMKYNKDIVLEIYNSNSEIGSHSYSHKNLTYISNNELDKEINSIEVIYNEITNDNLKYLRPPYGSYNDNIKSLNYPLILWNIDTLDWLNQNPNKIYNKVIKNACDGCIVLMHDTNFETIEAVRKLIPTLNNIGYNVVSISKLIEIKKYNMHNGETIRQIK